MSQETNQLKQRISQLESDNRVLRAALAKAQEQAAKLEPEKQVPALEAPRRGRPPKVAK